MGLTSFVLMLAATVVLLDSATAQISRSKNADPSDLTSTLCARRPDLPYCKRAVKTAPSKGQHVTRKQSSRKPTAARRRHPANDDGYVYPYPFDYSEEEEGQPRTAAARGSKLKKAPAQPDRELERLCADNMLKVVKKCRSMASADSKTLKQCRAYIKDCARYVPKGRGTVAQRYLQQIRAAVKRNRPGGQVANLRGVASVPANQGQLRGGRVSTTVDKNGYVYPSEYQQQPQQFQQQPQQFQQQQPVQPFPTQAPPPNHEAVMLDPFGQLQQLLQPRQQGVAVAQQPQQPASIYQPPPGYPKTVQEYVQQNPQRDIWSVWDEGVRSLLNLPPADNAGVFGGTIGKRR